MKKILSIALIALMLVGLTACGDMLDDVEGALDWLLSDDSNASSSRARTGTASFSEIRAAYKDNEIAADEEYKGNRYTFTVQFDGATDGGIGNMGGTITVTAKIMDGGTACYMYCKFPESERDKITELSKGDSFTFTGTCVDWGNWKDCKMK